MSNKQGEFTPAQLRGMKSDYVNGMSDWAIARTVGVNHNRIGRLATTLGWKRMAQDMGVPSEKQKERTNASTTCQDSPADAQVPSPGSPRQDRTTRFRPYALSGNGYPVASRRQRTFRGAAEVSPLVHDARQVDLEDAIARVPASGHAPSLEGTPQAREEESGTALRWYPSRLRERTTSPWRSRAPGRPGCHRADGGRG